MHLIGCHNVFGSDFSFLVASKIMVHLKNQWYLKFKGIWFICEMNESRCGMNRIVPVPPARPPFTAHTSKLTSSLGKMKKLSSQSERGLAENYGAS